MLQMQMYLCISEISLSSSARIKPNSICSGLNQIVFYLYFLFTISFYYFVYTQMFNTLKGVTTITNYLCRKLLISLSLIHS